MPKNQEHTVAYKIYFSTGERPHGINHKVKTEEEKKNHKAHQKKIKAKRNAKKGVYANKIKHPKNRGNK